VEASAGRKNCSSVANPAADLNNAQGHELLVENALVSVLDTDYLNAQIDPRPYDGADGWIHSRGVASRGDYANSL
jgi:hypothetical protein